MWFLARLLQRLRKSWMLETSKDVRKQRQIQQKYSQNPTLCSILELVRTHFSGKFPLPAWPKPLRRGEGPRKFGKAGRRGACPELACPELVEEVEGSRSADNITSTSLSASKFFFLT